MSSAWGVDSNNIIQKVYKPAPSGSDGDTVDDLTLRLPASGESAEYGDVGLRFDGTRAAGLIVTSASQANAAFLRYEAQVFQWVEDLIRYGLVDSGIGYLDPSYQAAKAALADSTAYPDALFITMCDNARMGATDVPNVEMFSTSLYAARDQALPSRAMWWIDKTTGAQTALNAMQDYGALILERPFTRPTVWRT